MIHSKKQGSEAVFLTIRVDFIKEGEFVVAYCPSLNLSSFGKDIEEAQSSFEEALEIFVEETQEMGTLEDVLLDLGWQIKKEKISSSFQPPALVNPAYSVIPDKSIECRVQIS